MSNFGKFYIKQQFRPSLLGILLNPFYFSRRGLYIAIKELSSKITGDILDVGCGQKPYRDMFKFNSYIGMDIEQGGHDHSNEVIDVFYDGEKFPFESGTFDSIICNEVFEHVFNPEEFIDEINRVLKMKGYFLFTVPFVWGEHEQPYDFARYSSFGLKFILEQNGFVVEKHRKTMGGVSTIFQLFNAYLYSKLISRNNYYNLIITLFIFAPVNLVGQLFASILPGSEDIYLDNVFLARKITNV
jgi:SAM-dependent methyltransferase